MTTGTGDSLILVCETAYLRWVAAYGFNGNLTVVSSTIRLINGPPFRLYFAPVITVSSVGFSKSKVLTVLVYSSIC